MHISKTSAKQIVNEISKLVKQNINLMDETGCIIASCDKDRIGQFHEGAYKIITEKLDEYYITDECPTMKSCLEKYGYPCAKEQLNTWEKRPSVLKSEYVSTKIFYNSRNKINTLNFFFSDGSAYAIAVDWTVTKDGGIVNREEGF